MWFSESISPLSETDDVVNKKWPETIPNLGLDRYCMSICVTSDCNLGQSWLKRRVGFSVIYYDWVYNKFIIITVT